MLRSVVGSRAPRRGTAAVLLAAVAGTALLTGCGAGQQAQTAAKAPSVPGVNATLQGIALRNVFVSYPDRERRADYIQGGNAPLEVRIFNAGTRTDALIGVRSEAAAQVLLNTPAHQDAGVCPQGSFEARTAQPTPATPSGPASPGAGAPEATEPVTGSPTGSADFSIELAPGNCALLVPEDHYFLELSGLREGLAPGSVIPVTFTFREAGSITLNVPFGLPTDGPEHTPLDIHPSEPPALGGHE